MRERDAERKALLWLAGAANLTGTGDAPSTASEHNSPGSIHTSGAV